MQNITLKIMGMSCGHCVKSIENAVQQAGGSGKVNLKTGSVNIEFDNSKTSLDLIKAAIEKQGYEVGR